MRTRNNRVFVYLDDNEMKGFDKKVKRSGLNRSTYLRFLIKGYGPTPSPDERFWADMNRINELANEIDGIAIKMERAEDIVSIMQEAKAWRLLRKEIEEHFLVPKKIDSKRILKEAAKAENCIN